MLLLEGSSVASILIVRPLTKSELTTQTRSRTLSDALIANKRVRVHCPPAQSPMGAYGRMSSDLVANEFRVGVIPSRFCCRLFGGGVRGDSTPCCGWLAPHDESLQWQAQRAIAPSWVQIWQFSSQFGCDFRGGRLNVRRVGYSPYGAFDLQKEVRFGASLRPGGMRHYPLLRSNG